MLAKRLLLSTIALTACVRGAPAYLVPVISCSFFVRQYRWLTIFLCVFQRIGCFDGGAGIMYSNSNFGGTFELLDCTANVCFNVASNMNDATSSLRIYDGTTCYFYMYVSHISHLPNYLLAVTHSFSRDTGCTGNRLGVVYGDYPTISTEFNDAISSYYCF